MLKEGQTESLQEDMLKEKKNINYLSTELLNVSGTRACVTNFIQ